MAVPCTNRQSCANDTQDKTRHNIRQGQMNHWIYKCLIHVFDSLLAHPAWLVFHLVSPYLHVLSLCMCCSLSDKLSWLVWHYVVMLMILNADLNEAFLNVCLYGWCYADIFVCLFHVCPYLCLSFILSLSLPFVCVVFPSLHVLCWSFLMSGRF